ncbi:unnamed protein product [Periconia digitata]|uniref:Uncharacterized protein n=1 Tax=Periconia digitata TaxID=1303443 RepID=A0A9W4XIB9_9PLEO|nr:unnamed protein product [Periconia digitata]
MTASPPTSPFLRLPRELRDVIYDYALYEPDGLYYWRDPTTNIAEFGRQPHQHVPANALKYTCHQLRQETLGLEFHLNQQITFVGSVKRPNDRNQPLCPAVQFLQFIDQCSEAAIQRWLRHVRLHYDLGHFWASWETDYRFVDLQKVADYCESRPNINVWWYTRMLEFVRTGRDCPVGVSILDAGLDIISVFRLEKRIKYLRISEDLYASTPDLFIDWRWFEGWHVEGCLRKRKLCSCNFRIRCENFRLLPEVPGDWEEQFYRYHSGWGDKELVRKRCELVRDVITNGI